MIMLGLILAIVCAAAWGFIQSASMNDDGPVRRR